MFGTKSDSYRAWKKEWQRYAQIPEKLDYANLGSTCDLNNYDYKYWSGIGFNFASAPQDMYYDNQLLEQYGFHLKEGAYVFISISEFALLVDKYKTDNHNFKYYGFLEPHRILNYSDRKAKIVKNFPGLLDSRYIKQEGKAFLKAIKRRNPKNSSRSLEECSLQSMLNWKTEFGWDKEIKLTNDQRETLIRSWEILQNDILYCKQHYLTPVIVIPPFNIHLKKLMPSHILNECLWNYIEKISNMGIKIVNFWNDTELEKEKYYRTPICLNEEGKRIFNYRIQNEVFGSNHSQRKKYGMDRMRIDKTNSLILNNGKSIPLVAFGTGVIKRFYRNKPLYYKDVMFALLRSVKHRKMVRFLKNDLTVRDILEDAANCGFRMFDTGRLYGHSEKYIGDMLYNHNRSDYFLITKVSDVDLMRYPDSKTVHDNLSISLKNLNTDYVDAYLLHFPSGDWVSMYKEIEKEYYAGRTKAIGVCNFDIHEMKNIIEVAEVKPMICQIEIHPLNNKRNLVSFCHGNGIIVMAHTPTGHVSKEIVDSDVFNDLVYKYQKSAVQIIYRWHIQNGVIPIVTSTSKQHLAENLEIFNFELSNEDMERIDSLSKGYSFDKYNNKRNDCPKFIYNL